MIDWQIQSDVVVVHTNELLRAHTPYLALARTCVMCVAVFLAYVDHSVMLARVNLPCFRPHELCNYGTVIIPVGHGLSPIATKIAADKEACSQIIMHSRCFTPAVTRT